MKRLALWMACCCIALAALASQTTAVKARGGYTLYVPGGEHGEHVPASIVANLDSSGNGSFHFAAETHIDHQMSPYPSLVVKLKQTESLTVAGKTAVLKGKADVHGELLELEASFTDGGPRAKDHFRILLRGHGDHVAFESEADLETGTITVGGAE